MSLNDNNYKILYIELCHNYDAEKFEKGLALLSDSDKKLISYIEQIKDLNRYLNSILCSTNLEDKKITLNIEETYKRLYECLKNMENNIKIESNNEQVLNSEVTKGENNRYNISMQEKYDKSKEELMPGLDILEPLQRKVLLLKYPIDGSNSMPTKKIAKEINKPETTVNYLIFTANKNMLEFLSGKNKETEVETEPRYIHLSKKYDVSNERLAEIYQQLPPCQREVILLRYPIDGSKPMSIIEIVKTLNKPKKTVEKLLSLAVKKVIKILGEKPKRTVSLMKKYGKGKEELEPLLPNLSSDNHRRSLLMKHPIDGSESISDIDIAKTLGISLDEERKVLEEADIELLRILNNGIDKGRKVPNISLMQKLDRSKEELEQVLPNLPTEEHIKSILLRHPMDGSESISPEEISQVLKIPVKRVANNIYRGLEKLSKDLNKNKEVPTNNAESKPIPIIKEPDVNTDFEKYREQFGILIMGLEDPFEMILLYMRLGYYNYGYPESEKEIANFFGTDELFIRQKMRESVLHIKEGKEKFESNIQTIEILGNYLGKGL